VRLDRSVAFFVVLARLKHYCIVSFVRSRFFILMHQRLRSFTRLRVGVWFLRGLLWASNKAAFWWWNRVSVCRTFATLKVRAFMVGTALEFFEGFPRGGMDTRDFVAIVWDLFYLLFGYRHFIIDEQRIGLFQGLRLWVLVGWKWHQVCPFYIFTFLSSSTLETTPGSKW